METYVAFLRGINVGGNSLLPMSELLTICEEAGFKNVRTYIQSGNVLFESELSETSLVNELQQALLEKKHIDTSVMIRTIKELEAIVSHNPFPNRNNSQVGVMFLTNTVPQNLIEGMVCPGREEVVLSGREIFIYYPDGMGKSKLKFPRLSQKGTVRNINTVTKLVALGRGM